MSKKDTYYFDQFSSCADSACQAAELLEEVLDHFDAAALKEKLDAMHVIEHDADQKKHDTMNVLIKAFITPIEREDLVALSSYLDDITDALDEVLMEFYICDIREIREDVLPFIDLLPECVSALHDVLKELKHFKTSKTIEDYIIKVNDLEEQGDKLYRICLHQLYQEEDVRTIIIWRNIYEGTEKCLDSCEHAVDIVSTVIMKNS